MSLKQIPSPIRKKYHIEEREHAIAILASDFRDEFKDLLACLDAFWLKRSAIVAKGGNRSLVSKEIDDFLRLRGWCERSFDTKFVVDGHVIPTPTHKIDNFKMRVGVEVEWNNKTEFFDRDLNNFRLLRQLKVLSVGVIITRLTELLPLFSSLGKGFASSASTTHWDKLIPKVEGGGAGGCPLLLVGMGLACYCDDE